MVTYILRLIGLLFVLLLTSAVTRDGIANDSDSLSNALAISSEQAFVLKAYEHRANASKWR